jgi:hypothetical protein
MALLDWIRRLLSPLPKSSTTAAEPAAFTDWTGYGYLGAVGESQYQPALREIARQSRICEATLIPEPDNPFDINAVVVKVNDAVVGYLPRSHARRYQRRLLTLAEPLKCPAKLIGGTADKPSIGVLLDTRAVEHMTTPKRPKQKKTVDPADTPF